jgi:hypothetical protein
MARTMFIISTVIAVAIIFFLWTQFDGASLLVKVLFSLFAIGIVVLNARQAFSKREH